MAKKHILNLAFEHNFVVVGIFSAEKDYRMCWLLDMHLGLNLKRLPDFTYPAVSDGDKAAYAVFHINQAAFFLDIYLIHYKS